MIDKNYMERYKFLLEYTNAGYLGVDEAGEEEQDMNGGPMDGPMGGPGGGPEMGADGGPAGGPMGGPMGGPEGANPGPGMDAPMGGNAGGPEGFNPEGADTEAMDGMGSEAGAAGEQGMGPDAMGANGAPGMGPENMPMDGPSPEDDVVEISDLTQSQESAEKKIDAMNKKFEKLLGVVEKMYKENQKRDEERERRDAERMDRFEKEMEKRNPTPMQRLSMRSAKSSPYTTTPDEYMNNYAPDNYSPADDNNGADDPQYKITKGDIDRFTNYSEIAKDLDIENQNLRNYLGF